MKRRYLVEWGKGHSKLTETKGDALTLAATLLKTYTSVSIKVTYKDIEP